MVQGPMMLKLNSSTKLFSQALCLKRIGLLLSAILICTNLSGQPLFKLDTSFVLQKYTTRKLVAKAWKEQIGILNQTNPKRLNLIVYNLSGTKIKDIQLHSKYFEAGIVDFAFDNETIFILTDDFISSFDFNNKLKGKQKNKNSYMKLDVWNDVLLLYKNYNFHPLDEEVKTEILTLEKRKLNTINQVKPTFDFYPFTHRVGKFVSTQKDNLFFAHTLDYKIFRYSGNLQLIDSIELDKPDWVQWTSTKQKTIRAAFETNNANVKALMPDLYKQDEFVSRVEKIISDDDLLLVVYKMPGYQKQIRNVDIHRKLADNSMAIVAKQTIVIEPSAISEQKFHYQPRLADSDFMYLYKGKLIQITKAFIPALDGLTEKELHAYTKDYFLREDPCFGVYIFDIILPE